MPLPIKTTIDDVQKVVAYLKTKPTGASVADAKAAVGAKHLDPRKVRAMEFWGIIKVDGDRLSLADDGRVLAREPDRAAEIYRRSIDRVRPYRAAIEWAFHQSFDQLDLNDTAAHWHQHQSDALGTTNETSIKDAVTCFFNLADGAGLGSYIQGRQGKSTRLELNKADVAAFIEAGPSTPAVTQPDAVDDDAAEIDDADEVDKELAAAQTIPPAAPPADRQLPGRLRVFVAHGKNMRVVEQVQTMLGLADIDNEVAEEEESTAIPVPEKVLGAMRRCSAGIICVSADDSRIDGDGGFVINENVLIEVGAAFVLYDQKVILLWDRRLKVPSNLQGLYRCEYEGDEIGWDAGMKLMKALNGFKR